MHKIRHPVDAQENPVDRPLIDRAGSEHKEKQGNTQLIPPEPDRPSTIDQAGSLLQKIAVGTVF